MGNLIDFFRNDLFAADAGIELLEAGEGRALARMTIGPRHFNAAGVVQGGAIFTLADLAFAAASNSRGRLSTGISVTITYMRPATAGTLTARAEEVQCGRTISTYLVTVTDEAGKPVALFQGTAFRLEKEVPLDAEPAGPA